MQTLPLPTIQEIKEQLPLSLPSQEWIYECRRTVQQILTGEDPRLLLILGPCSIHDITAAEEFATRLSSLKQKVSSEFFLVMRTYFEKARSGRGWKGFLYDPLLNGSYRVEEGIFRARSFLLSLAEMGIPAGAELLNPRAAPYYSDLLAWASIGARSCSSQAHRELAASLHLPVGIKNSTEGSIQSAVQAASVASFPQTILGADERGRTSLIQTPGNPFAHIVLRGGEQGPNYSEESILYALRLLKQQHLPPRLLVDCSHGNSGKIPLRQQLVFRSILDQIQQGNSAIRGWMVESHLAFGHQALRPGRELTYGQSITDPCLDWKSTEEMILRAYEELSQEKMSSAIDCSVPM